MDDRIQKSLEALGIRIIRQCSLGGWRQLDMRIEALHLMAPLHAMILPCFALFYYGLKAIDINAFRGESELSQLFCMKIGFACREYVVFLVLTRWNISILRFI